MFLNNILHFEVNILQEASPSNFCMHFLFLTSELHVSNPILAEFTAEMQYVTYTRKGKKVKLYLCLIKHHAMKTYGGMKL
jgi:hypothetical protein